MTKVIRSNICSAFDPVTIGTKVVKDSFTAWEIVCNAVANAQYNENGQAAFDCPGLIPHVRSGDAPKTNEAGSYHILVYRGEVNKFLRGEFADDIKVKSCLVVAYLKDAYLKDAYLKDPDVCGDIVAGIPRDNHEYERVEQSDCTHVVVAIIATGGPAPTVSPHRFVMNLAGGNNDYKTMTGDELRKKALEVKRNYESAWDTVADCYE